MDGRGVEETPCTHSLLCSLMNESWKTTHSCIDVLVAWSVFQAPVTDCSWVTALWGFLKVLCYGSGCTPSGAGLAECVCHTRGSVSPAHLQLFTGLFWRLSVTCTCSQEPSLGCSGGSVPLSRGSLGGTGRGCSQDHPELCSSASPLPRGGGKTRLASAAFCSESSFMFVLLLWL